MSIKHLHMDVANVDYIAHDVVTHQDKASIKGLYVLNHFFV